MTWKQLESECNACKRCSLAEGRNNVVIGRGCKTAPVLFVGDSPDKQEDKLGLPFVGQAGQLFDLVLSSLSFEEDEYYITNVIKCRQSENREPLKEECEACLPLLRKQFALIRPKIIVCLGNVAAKALIDKSIHITKNHGTWFEKKGVFFIATYHPAALLRDESKKIVMWEDLRKVKLKVLNEFIK